MPAEHRPGRSQPTYEGLKLLAQGGKGGMTRQFPAYLRGIETFENVALTYFASAVPSLPTRD